MAQPVANGKKLAVLTCIGAELRSARTAAGVSQEAVGEILGWQRDAISKIERGDFAIPLFEYMMLADFYRDVLAEGHPAVAMRDRFFRTPRGR